MTKEMVMTLLERLDRQGVLGTNGQDTSGKRESARIDTLIVSVVSTPLHRVLC